MRSKRVALAISALQTSILISIPLLTAVVTGTEVHAGEGTGRTPARPAVEDNRTERIQETLTAQGYWTGSIRPPETTEMSAPYARPQATPAKRLVRIRHTRPSAESTRQSPERVARYWTERLVHGLRRMF